MLITASCLKPVLSACFNSELWHLCILHACSSRHSLCLTHPPGFEMAVVFGEGSFSKQADLTLHLSCPSFHLLTLLLTQVGKNCWWQAEVGICWERAASTVPAQRILPGRLLCSCWGMGSLDLSLISHHNKGTLLESGAAIGQS